MFPRLLPLFGVELAGLVDEVGDAPGGVGGGGVALGAPAVLQDSGYGFGLGQAFGDGVGRSREAGGVAVFVPAHQPKNSGCPHFSLFSWASDPRGLWSSLGAALGLAIDSNVARA